MVKQDEVVAKIETPIVDSKQISKQRKLASEKITNMDMSINNNVKKTMTLISKNS